MKNKKINEKIYFKFLFRSLFFSSIIIFNFFFFFTQFFKLFDPKFKEPPFSHLLIYFIRIITHRRFPSRFYRWCIDDARCTPQ